MRPGVASWLRRCATRRTVTGSIPGGVTGFFSGIFPSDRTMAMGSTQPLVKMSTRNIPGDKRDRCMRLTTSPPSRDEFHEIWEPKPPGKHWATPGLLRDTFNFTLRRTPGIWGLEFRKFIQKNLNRAQTHKKKWNVTITEKCHLLPAFNFICSVHYEATSRTVTDRDEADILCVAKC